MNEIKKVYFDNLSGWLKILVVIGWLQIISSVALLAIWFLIIFAAILAV